MVTDAISDHFFVTEESAVNNLLREGKPHERIHFVGHVMIDNLLHQARKLEAHDCTKFSTHALKEGYKDYVFLTLHRPSNVDDKRVFAGIASALNRIAQERPILFPVHPRTGKMIDEFDIKFSDDIRRLPPLGFTESLYLWKDASLVMTDSGGLQEETTALGVPCLTLRENTERPITVEMGTNRLAGTTKDSILSAYNLVTANKGNQHSVPPKWDGRASQRIWKVLLGLGGEVND